MCTQAKILERVLADISTPEAVWRSVFASSCRLFAWDQQKEKIGAWMRSYNILSHRMTWIGSQGIEVMGLRECIFIIDESDGATPVPGHVRELLHEREWAIVAVCGDQKQEDPNGQAR